MNRNGFGLNNLLRCALGAGAFVLVACSGKVLTGSDNAQLVSVDSAIVSGAVTACGAGYAHPNVCCTAGPEAAAACGNYPSAPFHQCDTGSTTYPDPRSCCPLDANGNCIAPPPVTTPVPATCAYACPPGWFVPGPGVNVPPSYGTGSGSGGSAVACDPSTGVCAGTTGSGSGSGTDYGSGSGTYYGSGSGTDYGSGSGTDYGSGSGSDYGSGSGSSSNLPYILSGTCCQNDGSGDLVCATAADEGSSCACACPSNGPCPPCDCDAGAPPAPLTGCGACPAGWSVPDGEPDQCCRQDPNGVIDCFSQAISPVQVGSGSGSSSGGTVVAVDAGSAPTCAPLPCPSSASWDPTTCACVPADGGQ